MISVGSGFDGGNIEVLSCDGATIDLAIRRDAHSEFYQWFYFRLSGARDEACTVRITNCAGSSYPGGWPGCRAVISSDRQTWTRTDTSYADGILTIEVTPPTDSLWIAYFAPYSMERHHDLIARVGQAPGVTTRVLGQTIDGQDLDCVELGDGPLNVWLYARQHSGETMAEWWVEGVLHRLIDPADPVARALWAKARFHILPNMNPDGSRRGHLRTNAAGVNLNREWAAPTLDRSPEVVYVLAAMDATGVDFAMDVHGDESLPHSFIAGFEGIPNIEDRQLLVLADYKAQLARISPDFQTKVGYPPSAPGRANLTMSTNQLASRFGCLAMTLEMPFKDAAENPDALAGWSPERSKQLGRDCLAALLEVIDRLR